MTISLTALAETRDTYTIQIASFPDLESAKELAVQASEVLAVTVTVERSGNSYAVRAGKALIKEDLFTDLNTLRKSGYTNASIVSLPRSERSAVFSVPSGSSEEPSQELKESGRVLKLSQRQQPAELRAEKPKRESVEQSASDEPLSQKKSPQANLLEIKTKEQEGARAITGPEALTDERAPSGVNREEAELNLDRGWKGYKADRCEEAVDQFKEAEGYPGTYLEARLGLAYCYIKLDKKGKAVPLLEELVAEKYMVEKTLPDLLNLLIEIKDYDKAALYISSLSDEQKQKWNQRIAERKSGAGVVSAASREFEKAISTENTKAIIRLTNKYQNRLDKCIEPWTFYNAAQVLGEFGETEEARRIYYSLLSACTRNWDLRISALYGLKSLTEYSEIKPLINDEMKRAGLPPDYEQKLSELNVNILKESISESSYRTQETQEAADEILLIDPEDPDALLMKAWQSYDAKNYVKAREIFSKLHTTNPENKDYVLGLIYTLIELNEEDRALGLLTKSDAEDEEKNKIETRIYLKKANRFYEEGNYAESETLLEKVLVIDPENNDAAALLAWTLYNLGEYERALGLFLSLYEEDEDAETAQAVLNTYGKMGRQKDAVEFSYKIGGSPDISLQEVSGSYFASRGMPLTAAGIHSDPEAPYYNAQKPSFEFQPWFGYKTGDSGISELNQLAFPLTFSYPFKQGNDIRFSFTTRWLDSGDTPSSPFVGTAPEGGPQIRSLINSVWVFTPEIGFSREGHTEYNLSAGTTPLNGPVFSLPTFSLGLSQDLWRLNIHQAPVTESILSYVGLEDPYSRREWGRVLRTGAEAELNLTPIPHYWLTLIAGYDYYWGKNVKGNNAVYGTVSTGRTFTGKDLDLSLGLFFTTQHFERNSNFFTFGHGGYFSPDIFIMTGPTIRIETKPYKSYYLNAEAAAGYLYFRTEDSPFLPLEDKGSEGRFSGEDTSRIGFDLNIEALKLVTPHVALGAFGDINRSADYTEWSAGLTLRYYLSSRVGFVSSRSSKIR